MSVTVATMVKRVRRVLNDYPWQDVLTGSFASGATTTATVADTTAWEAGEILEFQDDGEQAVVLTITGATTMTVGRNYNSSIVTPAGHASGVVIFKTPAFQYVQVKDALEETMTSMWPYVYKKVVTTITPVAGTHYYELPSAGSEILELSSVVQTAGTSPNIRPFFYGRGNGAYPVSLIFDLGTDISTAGRPVLYLPYLQNADNAVRIIGIGKVTATITTTTYDDIVEGLMSEYIVLDSISRIVRAYDVPRASQEDITMGDQTVQPGHRTNIGRDWGREARSKRLALQAELRTTLPRMEYWNRGHKFGGI